MDKIETKLKTFSELLKEASATMPKDEWVCDECETVNSNWFPDMEHIRTRGVVKFKHGICPACREKEDQRLEKYDIDISEKLKKENAKILLNASKIPPKVLSANFENLQIVKGAELAFKTMKRIYNADRWIYLHGDNSTGKTLLVGATINMLANMAIPCFYFNERAFFRRIKETYDNGGKESSRQIFKNIRNADVIFWDDFSTLKYSDWELGTSYDILEICETFNKKLILISNIDIKKDINKSTIKDSDELSIRIGKRSLARIKRNNVFYVKMSNKSFA